jgi:hypothetical protein
MLQCRRHSARRCPGLQVPKARNQLKRISKLPFSPPEAEEFERAWLALAGMHIQGGKFDLAQVRGPAACVHTEMTRAGLLSSGAVACRKLRRG